MPSHPPCTNVQRPVEDYLATVLVCIKGRSFGPTNGREHFLKDELTPSKRCQMLIVLCSRPDPVSKFRGGYFNNFWQSSLIRGFTAVKG